MAQQPDPAQINPSELEVVVPPHLRVSLYANVVNVNASNDEVTLNFVSVNPHDVPQGTLVSRITVPRSMLPKLTDLLVELTEAVGRK